MHSTPINKSTSPQPLSLTSLMHPQVATLLMLITVVAVAAVFWNSPDLALALVFVGLCVLVAHKHRSGFILAAYASFPFQSSLTGENLGGNFSVSDALLIVAFLSLPILLLHRKRLVVGPAGTGLLLFLSLSTISSALHWDGLGTAVSLARMWVATFLAVLLFANVNDRFAFAHRCFTVFLAGINILSIGSVLAFFKGGINGSMYTFGNHKNLLGPMFGCGIVIALTYLFTGQARGRWRVWLALTVAGASIGILLSLSRGGWIATAIAIALLLLMLRQLKALVISVLVMVPLLFLVWQMLPEKATDYASDVSGNAHTIQTRLATINQVMDAYNESPLIGVGVGLRKKLEPHNVLVLTLGEEGILGVCCFTGMFAGGFYTFAVAWRWAKADVQARQIIIIGACLLLLSLVAGMMDVYWRRGVGFLGWAAVGMAANIIHLGQEGKLPTAAPTDTSPITAGKSAVAAL